MIFVVILSYVFIGFSEVPAMVHDKAWKELVVFSVLFLIGAVLLSLISFNVHIPSPIRGIRYFLTEVIDINWLSIRNSLR